MLTPMPKHTFDNDLSLNLKNVYRSRPFRAAINNILTMYVCFGIIIIFLQGLNLKSITSLGGLLLVCTRGIIGTRPFAGCLSLQHCQMCFGWGVGGAPVKGSTGTYLLSCKMIFCLFKRYCECVRGGISDLRVIKIWAHITQGLCTWETSR